MSTSTNPIDQIAQELAASNSKIGPRAVLSNLAIMLGLSVGTVLAFNILRPRNRIIYEPKVKYYQGEKQPPRILPGFFSWISPLIHTREPELLEKVGLDAVAYLRFLRLLRWLFTAIAALTCAILIPINVTYNLRHTPKNRTSLSMATVQDVRGNLLFVHVAMTYVITFLVLGFCWYHWREIVRLRHIWFRSDEYNKSFYARTLMVLRVPKKLQSDEGLKSLFESLRVPYPTTAVHIGRRVGQLPELIEYHNQAVRDLEEVLVRYLKNGQVAKKRPMIRQGGFWGIGGRKVDAVDFYTTRIKKAEIAIEDWRAKIDLKKAENYGFASMAAVPYAHTVARTLAGKTKQGAIVELAPNPKDILWRNIVKSDVTRMKDRTIGFLILTLVGFFYTLPLLIISFLANLSTVQAFVPFLQTWARNSSWSFTVVSGVLPPAISAFFGFFLPKIMRALSKYQGDLTRSRLDRAVTARYYGLLIISQLIIFTLIGVLYQSISLIILEIGQHKSASEIFRNVRRLPGQIQNTYIQQSSYWLTFFPLRGFLVFFDLAQLITLVWLSVKTRLFGRTPRDIREWTQPQSFEYSVYYPSLLFMAAVALAYAPLAPLVPLLAAAVFWVSSIVYKYQLMFVYVTKVESGGRLWNVVINRLLFSTVFMHLLMILTIGLVHGWKRYLWVAAVPPLFIVMIFKAWLDRQFASAFRFYVPDDHETAASKIHSTQGDKRGGKLEKRFGHPALHADLFTPMVHAKMVHLLPQVYHGRIDMDQTGLKEYGGEKVSAAVTSGGLRIAGIEQTDLAYDPMLYQRDRGEADWDARSVGTGTMLSDDFSRAGSPVLKQSNTFGSNAELESYLRHGPKSSLSASQSNIELSRLDFNRTTDDLPLLAHNYPPRASPPNEYPPPSRPFSAARNSASTSTLIDRDPRQQTSPPPPLHIIDQYRPASPYRPYPPNPSVSDPSRGGNLAGRGAGQRL